MKKDKSKDVEQTSKDVDGTIRDFAAKLKDNFSEQLKTDPHGFKNLVLSLIRRELPPRRGRPLNRKTEIALAMLGQGKTVREILESQIPGFDQLDTWGRMLAEKALRQAISRRRRLRGH